MATAVPPRNQVCAYKPGLLLYADVSGLFSRLQERYIHASRHTSHASPSLLFGHPVPGHHQLSWAPYHPSRVSPNPEGLCFKLCVLFVCHESFPVSNQHDSRGSDSLRQLPLCEEPLLTGLTLRNLGVRAGFRARDSEGAAGKCLQLWRQVLCGVVEYVGENEPRNNPAVTHSHPTLLPLQPER